MDDRIAIRRAAPEDAALIDGLVAALADHLRARDKKISRPADIAAALSGPDALLSGLIAEDAGGPLGMCLWYPVFSSWRGVAGAYVLDLYVAEAARGSGLGRRLLAEVAHEAESFGGRFLRLGVDKINHDAIAFYDRLGFSRMDHEHALDLSGEAYAGLRAAAGGNIRSGEPDRT